MIPRLPHYVLPKKALPISTKIPQKCRPAPATTIPSAAVLHHFCCPNPVPKPPLSARIPSIKLLLAANNQRRSCAATIGGPFRSTNPPVFRGPLADDLRRGSRLVAPSQLPNDDTRRARFVADLYVEAPAPRLSVVPLFDDLIPIEAIALGFGVGRGVIPLRDPHVADGRFIVHPGVRAGADPIAELRAVIPDLAGGDEVVAQDQRRGRVDGYGGVCCGDCRRGGL